MARSTAEYWIEHNPDAARKIPLNRAFRASEVPISRHVVDVFHGDGLIARVGRGKNGVSTWKATDRLRNCIDPTRKTIFNPPKWWDPEDDNDDF